MSARRRRRNQSTAEKTPAAKAPKAVASKPLRPPISRRRKWLFRLIVMLLAPVLFFAMLETGLRLGGYGYSTSFWIGPDADGMYTPNPQFGWRFFPRSLARKPWPFFLSTKPADTIRIFVLGSSAAQGVPDPTFNFGRILEAMLQDRYPGVKFEVVNAAMTAINSHVVREIARDCAAHQPDLFVVYMGNNEVIGPFGPGTVFQKWSPSLTFIRASNWVKSTRVGQMLGDAIQSIHSSEGTPSQWQGMEMFLGNPVAADDPRLETVYENYRRNLTDICRIARRADASVILSTVAVNLKDCPPLASQHRSGLSERDLSRWERTYQAGIELETQKQIPEAIAKYEEAAEIDGRHAELSFRLGRCLAALGRSEEARKKYALARDLDVLRFRADSRIEAIIRETADDRQADGVCFVDAEQSLAKSDLVPDGILGGDLFYEHVHLTHDGNYLLAGAVLDQVEVALPKLVSFRKEGPVLSKQQCAESMVLTPWDEFQMASQMAEMTSRPPFTNQLDHAARQVKSQIRAENLKRRASTPQALEAECKSYKAALEAAPDDWNLHQRFGKLALANGQSELAIDHLLIAQKKLPEEASVYIDLGNAVQRCGRIDEAIAYFEQALKINPAFAMAHNNLGVALAGLGRTDEAITRYRKALEIDPGYTMAYNNLALAQAKLGQTEEAIDHYRKALEIDPACVPAHNNLGIALSSLGRFDEAVSHYRKALEIDPESAIGCNNLGDALKNLGRIDEAIVQYQKAVESDPKLALAHHNLGNVLRDRGRIKESIAHFEKALEIHPKYAMAHNDLGIAYDITGRLDEAIDHYRKALEIDPMLALAHNNLGSALAARGKLDEAIAHYRNALAIDPKFAMVHRNLGDALKSRGRIDEAVEHYKKALELDPSFTKPPYSLDKVLAGLVRGSGQTGPGQPSDNLKKQPTGSP